MRWAGLETYTGEQRNAYRVLVETPIRKRPLGRPRYKWTLILKLLLDKWNGMLWTRLIWLIGTGGWLLLAQ
jgi:hypothetical protein